LSRRPRIEPVSEPTGEVASILASFSGRGGSDPLAVFATLANNPRLLKRFSVYAGLFTTKSELTARQRELVILRVAWRVDCEYEWGQHVLFARRCGVPDHDIQAVRSASPEATGLAASEVALLTATDQLLEVCDISDAAWIGVRDFLNESQMLEFIMLVGLYRMLAGMLKSVGVELDPGVPGW
jgi:alkylhydroperoxidase family enzyme